MSKNIEQSYEQEFGEATFVFAAKCHPSNERGPRDPDAPEVVEFHVLLDADYPFTEKVGRALFYNLFPKLVITEVVRCCRVGV